MLASWFPRNFEIADDIKLVQVLFAGTDWQIFTTQSEQSVLVAKESLVRYWVNSGYIEDTQMEKFLFGKESFCYLASPQDVILRPVNQGPDIVTYEDGLSFATALQKTREISSDASFTNGIFVERYTRILPCPDAENSEDDAIVLGRWLSRGIEIPANSTRRILQLLPTVTEAGLEEILAAARLKKQPQEENVKEQSEKEKQPFTLPGRQDLETFFKDHIIDIIENPDDYKNMGINFPSAFILQGPPGCGKTYAVDKLVEYLDWPCYAIDSGAVGSPFIHETSKKISEIFQKAIDNSPSVLVIDEMESFLSDRATAGAGGGHHVEEVAEFLRKIPEATGKHVLVIAMTNMISSIDPAICRKGRFDHIIEVGMPSQEEILAVLENGLAKVPHDDFDLDKICVALTGHPMSDVSFVLREAARITAKSHLKSIPLSAFDSVISMLEMNKKTGHRPIGFGVFKGDEK